MEKWFKIQAYNSTPYWAWGTEQLANKFADTVDGDREINIHVVTELSASEVAEMDLENNSEAFSLSDWASENDAQ